MAVTSKPLDPQPRRQSVVSTHSRYEPGLIIGALVGLGIGAVVWLFGAKYTIDGLVLITNRILAFFTVPYQVDMTPSLYLWLACFPLAFSAVEWTCSPIGRNGARHAGIILTWIVVIVIDLITTVIGLRAGGGIEVVVWIVSSSVGLASLAGVLTFGPEWLMKSCGGLIGRAVKSIFGW
jgi:hypothetical protein